MDFIRKWIKRYEEGGIEYFWRAKDWKELAVWVL